MLFRRLSGIKLHWAGPEGSAAGTTGQRWRGGAKRLSLGLPGKPACWIPRSEVTEADRAARGEHVLARLLGWTTCSGLLAWTGCSWVSFESSVTCLFAPLLVRGVSELAARYVLPRAFHHGIMQLFWFKQIAFQQSF